eukprot:scaffold23983_cov61-Cyclotella_meneghiniana.AAC.1
MYEMLSDNSKSVVIELMSLDRTSTDHEPGKKLEFCTEQRSEDIHKLYLRAIELPSLLTSQ